MALYQLTAPPLLPGGQPAPLTAAADTPAEAVRHLAELLDRLGLPDPQAAGGEVSADVYRLRPRRPGKRPRGRVLVGRAVFARRAGRVVGRYAGLWAGRAMSPVATPGHYSLFAPELPHCLPWVVDRFGSVTAAGALFGLSRAAVAGALAKLGDR